MRTPPELSKAVETAPAQDVRQALLIAIELLLDMQWDHHNKESVERHPTEITYSLDMIEFMMNPPKR